MNGNVVQFSVIVVRSVSSSNKLETLSSGFCQLGHYHQNHNLVLYRDILNCCLFMLLLVSDCYQEL